MIQKKKPNRYSISKKLREQNRSNDFFELMLGNLNLEELIALKLEVTFRSMPTPIFGMPIWNTIPKIARHAVIRYAYSITASKLKAARFLGMNQRQFDNYLCKYEIKSHFSKEKGDDHRNTIKADIPKSTS